MCVVCISHPLGGFDHVVPLQGRERPTAHLTSISLLVPRLLLDRPERICLGETFIIGVLIEAAADGENLRHGALRWGVFFVLAGRS